MIKEFKEFISKGNALDLAIGIMIGAAFGAIVNSIVNDLFMPIVSLITGGFKLAERMWVLREGVDEASTIAIRYGSFFQQIINFLIIGFILFLIVKGVNTFRRQEEKKEEKIVPSPSEEVLLLREIRDNLTRS